MYIYMVLLQHKPVCLLELITTLLEERSAEKNKGWDTESWYGLRGWLGGSQSFGLKIFYTLKSH